MYRDNIDSRGVKWIGEVAERLSINAVKQHYDIQLGKMLQNTAESEQDISVPYLKALHVLWGLVEIEDLPHMWASPSEILQYGVKSGDLLVCEGGEVGRAGVVDSPPEECIIQNALHRVRSKTGANVRYLHYVLHLVSSAGWFDVLCNKATIAHFTREKFADLQIPISSNVEQIRIAAFLDRETTRIDQLIAKKERQIELLQEKRSALISHAVTKGLNPKAKMKDSGIEWLGEIPEHWEVKRLKRIARLRSGESITSSDIGDSGEYPVYGGNGLRGYTAFYTHEGEFVLIGRQGALCGCINYASGRFWASEHAVVVSPIVEIATIWLGELLRTMELNRYSQSAAQPGLAVETIAALFIPAPPFVEQTAIASILKRETERIDALSEKIRHSIERLQEYRTALISAAVTGKIDVREMVA